MRNTIRLSSFLVIASLLVGGAVGGIVGAFLAVPTVAAVEVILERLQVREVPVTQAPGGIETDEEPAADAVAGAAAIQVTRPTRPTEATQATQPTEATPEVDGLSPAGSET